MKRKKDCCDQDWEELMDMIVLGRWSTISARHGRRAAAASQSGQQQGADPRHRPQWPTHQTLPRGLLPRDQAVHPSQLLPHVFPLILFINITCHKVI